MVNRSLRARPAESPPSLRKGMVLRHTNLLILTSLRRHHTLVSEQAYSPEENLSMCFAQKLQATVDSLNIRTFFDLLLPESLHK